jgi:hypothetical protein
MLRPQTRPPNGSRRGPVTPIVSEVAGHVASGAPQGPRWHGRSWRLLVGLQQDSTRRWSRLALAANTRQMPLAAAEAMRRRAACLTLERPPDRSASPQTDAQSISLLLDHSSLIGYRHGETSSLSLVESTGSPEYLTMPDPRQAGARTRPHSSAIPVTMRGCATRTSGRHPRIIARSPPCLGRPHPPRVRHAR